MLTGNSKKLAEEMRDLLGRAGHIAAILEQRETLPGGACEEFTAAKELIEAAMERLMAGCKAANDASRDS